MPVILGGQTNVPGLSCNHEGNMKTEGNKNKEKVNTQNNRQAESCQLETDCYIAPNTFLNADCMDYLPKCPDGYFDLAIVDPPYGGGQHFNFRFGIGDKVYRNEKPGDDYWTELFRISKNQIIWGANYFQLPISRCWISWYKGQPIDSFSDFELAWTSFDKTSRQINLESYGFRHGDKRKGETTIHPTQKPVELYKELLRRYAKPGDLILDSHVGSGSSLIACKELGFDYVGFEIDKDYYEGAVKRLNRAFRKYELQF